MRSIWVKEWIRKGREEGAYQKLLQSLKSDPMSYTNYLRMDEATFQILLREVEPIISKKNSRMRESISAAERLVITLRFLATGQYQKYFFRNICRAFYST